MFRNTIQRFMYGRYGVDTLNRALLYSGLGLLIVSLLINSHLLNSLSLALYVMMLVRALSRNFPARQAENARYLRLTAPISRRLKLLSSMLRDREHRYFACPKCGQFLRVPRGKGRISVTCRSCGTRFDKKS